MPLLGCACSAAQLPSALAQLPPWPLWQQPLTSIGRKLYGRGRGQLALVKGAGVARGRQGLALHPGCLLLVLGVVARRSVAGGGGGGRAGAALPQAAPGSGGESSSVYQASGTRASGSAKQHQAGERASQRQRPCCCSTVRGKRAEVPVIQPRPLPASFSSNWLTQHVR